MELAFPKNLFRPQQSYEEWMGETVDFFRQLGFFEQWKRFSTEKLIEKLERLQEASSLPAYRPFIKTTDFDLIAWDKKRVWFLDADALVLPKNEAYVQALQELSAISRRQFLITGVEELWEGEEGPIRIRFTHKRKQYTFYPRYVETYFDFGIFSHVSTCMQDTKFRFEVCGDILGNPIVLMLHAEEKELLRAKRGWKFTDA